MELGGYVNTDTQGKTGFGVFGLNQGAKVLDISYQKELDFGDGLSGTVIEYELNGAVKKDTIVDVYKVTVEGVEISDPNHAEFKKQQTIWKQRMIHLAEAFVSKDEVIEAVSQPHNSYESFANTVIDLVKANLDTSLDLFLQYQWQQKEGADRKFLEIPKKVKQGFWVIPSVEGTWSEVRISEDGTLTKAPEGMTIDNTGRKPVLKLGDKEVMLQAKDVALCYVNENLELHPFYRSNWFMTNGWGQSGETVEDTSMSSWT